ncbi:LysR family transcriptional regulator [Salmonella enterica subsp. enterica serovar Limete]|nr:LysR family transcriptional regulator [Salmonella enterica subsp. enterica serovar Limete]
MKTTPVGKKHRQPLEGWPSVEDLFVFVTVARNGGFARAALELGLSPSYISKRIAILEKCLNARLFFRNNRVMRLTPEDENALCGAMQVVSEMDGFVSRLDNQRGVLAGNITINCSFGFGHKYVAEALSSFMIAYPDITVKLTLTDREVDLVEEGVDIEIRVGDDINELYIARQLATNRRILCASPEYLERHGKPESVSALVQHDCLMIQEKNSAFGNWILTDGKQQTHCRLNGFHSSNSGSVVLIWALKGHGITLRSEWDVAQYIERGELVRVLPQWYQEANIWAVYTRRSSSSDRIKICIDFLTEHLAQCLPGGKAPGVL